MTTTLIEAFIDASRYIVPLGMVGFAGGLGLAAWRDR